jgi:DNA-binding response OmpR family regulator
MSKLKPPKPFRDSRYNPGERTRFAVNRGRGTAPVPASARIGDEGPTRYPTTIILFEDAMRHTRYVRRILTEFGYECRSFRKLDLLTARLQRARLDLLILIGHHPDSGATHALDWVREHCAADLPVLFIDDMRVGDMRVGDVRRGTDESAVLDAGADDYVVATRSPEILLARVASLLRRAHKPATPKPEHFGAYAFDTLKCRVTLREQTVTLTQREFALAYLLFRHVGLPLSRTHILELIWHQTAGGTSRTVDTHMCWLRTKLQLCPENDYVLVSVYGFGYCLECVRDA